MKIAVVEVCYWSQAEVLRCPQCGSLNINDVPMHTRDNGIDEYDLLTCPDCGCEVGVPAITECDCIDHCGVHGTS